MKKLEDGKIEYNIFEKPFSKLGNYLHGKHWERIANLYDEDNDKLTHGLGLDKYEHCMDAATGDSQTLFQEGSPFSLLFIILDFHVRTFFSILSKIVTKNIIN